VSEILAALASPFAVVARCGRAMHGIENGVRALSPIYGRLEQP